ncbi:MAG TPA: hypothetical protein VKT30_12840 [Caulobacteraceae bacterium]|nr:hypothetical protein [Caulobacteraceae bacterium]
MRSAVFGLILACVPAVAAAQGSSQLIPGAGDWTLTTVPKGGCYARLTGREVDTMVMVNRFSKPVITIGRPDWRLGTTDLSVDLRIDMGPVHRLTVSPIDTIAMVAIDDDLRNQVLNAKSMTWSLPNGTFTASVAGLGKAFQAVIPCGLAAAQATPPPS